jgi:multiple sugar transport system ATP-binding protein
VGRPLDLYSQPANQFVAGFIGSPKMNFLACTAQSRSDAGLQVALADGSAATAACTEAIAAGTPLVLGIRPEHMAVAGLAQTTLQGDVVVAERLGGETYFHVRYGDQMLIAKASGDSAVGTGERVSLALDPGRIHLFVPGGRRIA